jgi:hypothetical protein
MMFRVSIIAVRLPCACILPLSTAPLIREFFLSSFTNAQAARERDHMSPHPRGFFLPGELPTANYGRSKHRPLAQAQTSRTLRKKHRGKQGMILNLKEGMISDLKAGMILNLKSRMILNLKSYSKLQMDETLCAPSVYSVSLW